MFVPRQLKAKTAFAPDAQKRLHEGSRESDAPAKRVKFESTDSDDVKGSADEERHNGILECGLSLILSNLNRICAETAVWISERERTIEGDEGCE